MHQNDPLIKKDIAELRDQASEHHLKVQDKSIPQSQTLVLETASQLIKFIAQFCSGLRQCFIKSYRMSIKHPWWSCFGVFVSIASAVFICKYCGVLGIAGMIIYALKSEKD